MVWICCVPEIVSKCLQEFLLLVLTVSWNMQYYHHSNFTDKEAETAKFCNLPAIMHVESGGIMFWTWTVLSQGNVTLRILQGVIAWACSGLDRERFWSWSSYFKKGFVLICALLSSCTPISEQWDSFLVKLNILVLKEQKCSYSLNVKRHNQLY